MSAGPADGLAASVLGLLACALGEPGLQLQSVAGAGRWRGPLCLPLALPLADGAPHRVKRLQVLRRVLDSQPGGRGALRIAAGDGSGLLGPHRPAGEAMLDVDACLLTWPRPRLLRRLFLRVDGQRVDALLAHRYPGAARDLVLDPAPALPARVAAPAGLASAPTDAAGALRLALSLHRALLTGARQPAPVAAAPAPFTVLPPLADTSPAGTTGRDASPGNAAEVGDAAFAPGDGQGGAIAPGPRDRLAQPERAAAPGRASPPDPAAAGAADPPAAPPRLPAAPTARPQAGTHITRHDEWDHRQRCYLHHWVQVHERPLLGSDLAWRDALLARFPALAQQIRRRFVHLRGDAPVRERRLPDGEAIDFEAALAAFVARRAGAAELDDRVYQARPRQRREVAVALLIDASGSTGYDLPGPPGASDPADDDGDDDLLWQPRPRRPVAETPPRRRVIDVVKDAAGLLCEALQGLGDRHAVYAFSGHGRHNVDFLRIKPFGQAWSAAPAAALAALQPMGSTRTGAAVRQALLHLRAEPARQKMLIVLSDGYPQDSDYGPPGDEPTHGLMDTAQALAEGERAGIRCFNLSVDAAANDYLRRICPPSRYWVVDEVDALPDRLLALYRLMATAA